MRLSTIRKPLTEKKCTRCESTQNIHSHHLNVWRKGLRQDMSYGMETIYLCRDCHSWVHSYANKDDEYLVITRSRPDSFGAVSGEMIGGEGELPKDWDYALRSNRYILTDEEKSIVRELQSKLKAIVPTD